MKGFQTWKLETDEAKAAMLEAERDQLAEDAFILKMKSSELLMKKTTERLRNGAMITGFKRWLQVVNDSKQEDADKLIEETEARLDQMKVNAAEAFFKKSAAKSFFAGISQCFRFWADIIRNGMQNSLEEQNEELNEVLFMMKHNAADMSARKNLQSWAQSSLYGMFSAWKEVIFERRVEGLQSAKVSLMNSACV